MWQLCVHYIAGVGFIHHDVQKKKSKTRDWFESKQPKWFIVTWCIAIGVSLHLKEAHTRSIQDNFIHCWCFVASQFCTSFNPSHSSCPGSTPFFSSSYKARALGICQIDDVGHLKELTAGKLDVNKSLVHALTLILQVNCLAVPSPTWRNSTISSNL